MATTKNNLQVIHKEIKFDEGTLVELSKETISLISRTCKIIDTGITGDSEKYELYRVEGYLRVKVGGQFYNLVYPKSSTFQSPF